MGTRMKNLIVLQKFYQWAARSISASLGFVSASLSTWISLRLSLQLEIYRYYHKAKDLCCVVAHLPISPLNSMTIKSVNRLYYLLPRLSKKAEKEKNRKRQKPAILWVTRCDGSKRVTIYSLVSQLPWKGAPHKAYCTSKHGREYMYRDPTASLLFLK